VNDLTTDLHGHATEYAMDLDRAYFTGHPSETTYDRPAVDHEMCVGAMIRGAGCEPNPQLGPPPPHPYGPNAVVELWIRVTYLGVGARMRAPFWVVFPNGKDPNKPTALVDPPTGEQIGGAP
jgi:hypothetical protein